LLHIYGYCCEKYGYARIRIRKIWRISHVDTETDTQVFGQRIRYSISSLDQQKLAYPSESKRIYAYAEILMYLRLRGKIGIRIRIRDMAYFFTTTTLHLWRRKTTVRDTLELDKQNVKCIVNIFKVAGGADRSHRFPPWTVPRSAKQIPESCSICFLQTAVHFFWVFTLYIAFPSHAVFFNYTPKICLMVHWKLGFLLY